MERDTDNQIHNELKSIHRSLDDMNHKIDAINRDGKPPFILWDIIKSLIIGVFILGPALAVAAGIFQIISSWLVH